MGLAELEGTQHGVAHGTPVGATSRTAVGVARGAAFGADGGSVDSLSSTPVPPASPSSKLAIGSWPLGMTKCTKHKAVVKKMLNGILDLVYNERNSIRMLNMVLKEELHLPTKLFHI